MTKSETKVRGGSTVRAILAGNSATTAQDLEELAQDEVAEVRLQVAGNPNTPLLVLEQLAQDEVDEVRVKAVENPNGPGVVEGLDEKLSEVETLLNSGQTDLEGLARKQGACWIDESEGRKRRVRRTVKVFSKQKKRAGKEPADKYLMRINCLIGYKVDLGSPLR